MKFSRFCMDMYTENCHEKRQNNEDEYTSVDEYIANGTNLIFLERAYQDYLTTNEDDEGVIT